MKVTLHANELTCANRKRGTEMRSRWCKIAQDWNSHWGLNWCHLARRRQWMSFHPTTYLIWNFAHPSLVAKKKIKKSVSMNFDLAMAEESNADSRSLYQSLLDAVIYSNGKKKNPLTAPWFYFCAMHPSSQRTAGIPRVTGSTSSLELLSSFTAHSTQKTRC